jgi:SAM-dependent methyltransferase
VAVWFRQREGNSISRTSLACDLGDDLIGNDTGSVDSNGLILNWLAAGLNSVVLRSRARQCVRVSNGVAKVNLGSGLTVAPGWINVDASPNALVASLPAWLLRWAYRFSGSRDQFSRQDYVRILTHNRFVHHDLGFGIPLNDSTVDFVYSSHMLEHLYPKAGELLLKEVHRVLKSGGVVRICVPDLGSAVAHYQAGDRVRFLAHFFPADKRNELGRHRYMYDYWMLERLLASVGFTSIRRLACGAGASPDIDMLDNRADETLYVEALK